MDWSTDRARTKDRLFVAAYLIHLAAPVFLFLDVVLAWRFPVEPGAAPAWWISFTTTGQALFAFSLVWFVAALGLLVSSRGLGIFSPAKLYKPLVAVYASIIALLIIEMFLQVGPGSTAQPALWPEGRDAILAPEPDLLPGVEGNINFTGNDVGLRGPPFPDDTSVFRIVTIGGSTTENLYLDDLEEWPHLIMERLNQSQQEIEVWVGNGGQSGRNAVDHLTLLEVLPVIQEADLLIFLVGLNDMVPTISFNGAPTQEFLESNTAKFRQQVIRGGGRTYASRPYFKHSELYKLVRQSALPALAQVAPSAVLGQLGVGPGSYINDMRQQRADGSVATLPDLELGLTEYRARIRAIASECRSRYARCVFVTQPSMWRSDLTPQEEALLWSGWVGGVSGSEGYLSVDDLARAMQTYNRTLLDVCREDSLECFDLAPSVPKNIDAFLDDVHFNESGARIVAELLTDYILANAPFAE